MLLSFSEKKSDPVEFWYKILSFSQLFTMSSRLQQGKKEDWMKNRDRTLILRVLMGNSLFCNCINFTN